MYRIGLTGGIATGKSTVAEMLRQLGAQVIDADQVAREVMQPGQPAYADIVAYFGPAVAGPAGLDRERLAELVFSDATARLQLNRMTHPRIINRIEELIDELIAGGHTQVVLDVPLLIEAGMTASVDEIWLVVVDAATQLERLMSRDNLTQKQALARIAAQMPLQQKKKYADYIIDNSGTQESTLRAVQENWCRVVQMTQHECK